jgi:hypothetical protein
VFCREGFLPAGAILNLPACSAIYAVVAARLPCNSPRFKQGFSGEKLNLVLKGDTVFFQFVGGETGWRAQASRRAPSGEIVRANSQSINQGAVTQI